MKNRMALLLLLFLIEKAAVAGSVEYDMLIPSRCAHYLVEDGYSFPNDVEGRSREEQQQEYDKMISRLKEGKDDDWQPWGFSDMKHDGGGHYTGLCREVTNKAGTPVSLACIGEPTMPITDLTCKFGSTGPSGFHRNAQCRSKAYPHQEIKMYWVDTAEYELGGEPLVNWAYQRDRKRMATRCKMEIP